MTTTTTHKLYEIELPERIYVLCSDDSTYVTVDHLDGMYSFGKTEKGHIIHLAGAIPLKKCKDGYEIAE